MEVVTMNLKRKLRKNQIAQLGFWLKTVKPTF